MRDDAVADMKVCLVIPAFNHGSSIREVILEALKYCSDICVVNDGSSDDTLENIADLPVHVITHPQNRGKGEAIKTGASFASEHGFSHIITLDADGQHKACDLPAFIQAIKTAPTAMIVGARDFSAPNVPGSSKFGRSFSGFWMFLQTGTRVSDMQSGFRAYPLSVLETLKCASSRYAFEIEILVQAAWAGFEIREIPVCVWYPPKDERVSHFRPFVDNLRISLLNTRLTMRALMPIPFKRQALDIEGRLSLLRPGHTFRMLACRTDPDTLARSAAWALLVSMIPILGLNTILLLFIINWKHLDRLCALVVVPLSWLPVVPALCVIVGYRLLHDDWLTEYSVQTLGYEAGSRFLEWLLGSLLVVPVIALSAYFLLRIVFRFWSHRQ